MKSKIFNGCKSVTIYTLLLLGLTGCFKKEQTPVATEKTEEVSSAPSSLMSPQDKVRFYRWLFQEMHQQIFQSKPETAEDERGWLNILNQGASIEGVYHGLVLSTTYRAKEVGATTPGAIRYFASEAILLRANKSALEPAQQAQYDSLVSQTLSTSLFTLKRELGELILREIEKRKGNRAELAEWFGRFAARASTKGVDLGMAQRSNPDMDYHRAWATKNSIGLIQWEALNRAHRILNQLGSAQGGKSP